MPTTAFQHFQDDIARAKAIVVHVDSLPPQRPPSQQRLRSDLLRSAWMFAVGALDAYFCDAYTDVVAATIISKMRHPSMILPNFFNEIRFPVRAIVEPYQTNPNWRWRMAARKMMEGETVLSLETIQNLFNKFFRLGQRFFGDLLDRWIPHPEAKRRIFGIGQLAYLALPPADKDKVRRVAKGQMQEHFRAIFKRRHDCIHNCDRPRVALQPLASSDAVRRVIEDVEFLVARCNEHINAEFREFLLGTGCPAAIVSQAGY